MMRLICFFIFAAIGAAVEKQPIVRRQSILGSDRDSVLPDPHGLHNTGDHCTGNVPKGALFEVFRDTFDDDAHASLLSNPEEIPDPASLTGACDSLGEAPYFFHPFDTSIHNQLEKLVEYSQFVSESQSTPSLAELQKMPMDELAMRKVMSRLAQAALSSTRTIRVAVMGGSMTRGSACRTPTNQLEAKCSWPYNLERWLKKTFSHADVSVINMARGGMDSLSRLFEIEDDLDTAKSFGNIDLWILDHGVNDANGWPCGKSKDQYNGGVLENLTHNEIYSIATEALILKIQRAYPRSSLMMLATACGECLSYKENALQIARHHHIAYVDYGFLVEQRGAESGQECSFVINGMHKGRHCGLWEEDLHPPWHIHQRVADTIGYQMGRALSDVCNGHQADMRMLTLPAGTFWPKTAMQPLSRCDQYLARSSALKANEGTNTSSVSARGWNLIEEIKGKPGWIANEIGARITFPLTFGGVPTIGIEFLRSYEKMGQASIQIVDGSGMSFPLGDIDGLWEHDRDRPRAKLSVPDINWYYPKVSPNSKMSLIVDLIDSDERDSHKMKLLSVVSC
jgi:hypothetical protein